MEIELRNVRKCFGDTEVLRGLNLRIASGQRVGLVGPNGSGKSTLMNLLGCLDSPTGGVYELLGKHAHYGRLPGARRIRQLRTEARR